MCGLQVSTNLQSTDILTNDQEFDESSWVLCASQLEDIVSDLVECRKILTKIKSDLTPNPIIFLLES